MLIGILGPLTLNSNAIRLTAAKPKKVLALLLLRGNTTVSTHELVDEIWGDDPPKSAATTLQTYVLQLRKLLFTLLRPNSAHEAKKVLKTVSGGYMFCVQRGELDLDTFKWQAQEGIQALDQGDNELASVNLRRALGLWRGPSLVDVQHGRVLQVHVNHMEQCRLSVLERCIDAELRLGLHHRLLSELAALTTAHRFNESLYAKFMLALYRSGQRGRALSVFQQLRQTLADELGLDPDANLQRLHQAILSLDPALDALEETRKHSLINHLVGSLAR